MGSRVDFIDKHKNKTVDELEKMKKCIISDPNEKDSYGFIAAIDMMIDGKEITIYSEKIDEEIRIAKTYISKINNAFRRGIRFDLTIREWRRLQKLKLCEYTGVKLLDDVGFNHMQKRTIDRIDNSKGYEPGNVKAVSWKANQMKNFLFENPDTAVYRMTKKEFSKFALTMIDQLNSGDI